jgi:hypothetical protein
MVFPRKFIPTADGFPLKIPIAIPALSRVVSVALPEMAFGRAHAYLLRR